LSAQKPVSTPRVILQVFVFIVLIPLLPLVISRQWDWWEAWVYAILYIVSFIISRALAARRNPDIIQERARSLQHENAEAWDKRLAPLLGIGGLLALVVAGLDALFAWPPTFSLAVKILALAIIVAGYVLGSYALIENRFFSGVVRLQPERGQQVVSSGPYRWIRHPGYVGSIIVYLATPLFLDSIWAFIPVIFLTVVLVVRTALEDRFLQAQLPGYREYAGRVRYRLLPGVW
jgi:protein-S-isoprenylcysteine O-methyltransferase Ste14